MDVAFLGIGLLLTKGGNKTLIEGIYEDRWSYFEITGLVENDLIVKKTLKVVVKCYM